MPISRKRKNTKSKPKTKTLSTPKVTKPSWLPQIKIWTRHTWTLIVGSSGVISLLGGLLVFASRVSVSSSSPLNLSDPFAVDFTVNLTTDQHDANAGDGAVFRDGAWYLQRSTAGFTGVQFGAAMDKTVLNAFVP